MTPRERDQLDGDRRRFRRAVAINVAGTIGKALWPLFLALAARRHGMEVLGTFLVLQAAVEIAHGMIASGYVDALHRHTARRPGDALPAGFHALVRGSLRSVLVTEGALVVCALGGVSAAGLAREVVTAVALMGGALVPQGGISVLLAPCTAMMRNEYEVVIRQLLAPALVNAFVLGFPAPSLVSIAAAFALAYAVCGMVAVLVARRQFGFSLEVHDQTPSPAYRRFAVLQGLNVGLWTSIYSLDTILLALFVASPMVALYRAGSEITRALYLVRIQFSGAYAPLAARYLADGDLAPLARLLASLSTTVTWIGAIVAGVVVLLREPLLAVALDVAPAESGFVIILVAGQLLLCATSLTGNTLAMRGLATLLVKNGLVMLVVNSVLNLVLVPVLGLAGAALATLLAMSVSQALQIFELRAELGLQHAPRGPLGALVAALGAFGLASVAASPLAGGSALVVATTLYVAVMLISMRYLRPARAARDHDVGDGQAEIADADADA